MDTRDQCAVSDNIHRMTRPQPLARFSPTKWQGQRPPGHDWIVDGCFLRGTVAMFSGDGGVGKSLALQQLATAAAVGRHWLGLDTKSCKSLMVFCEDDEDELHRRQDQINAHYDCDYGDLDSIEFLARVGQESALAHFSRNGEQMQPTILYNQLEEAARDHGAQIIVFDTVADVFTGDEIRRSQVRRFVTLLRRLAVAVQGVVILTAHPSLTGMASGTGLSGSTAWNNSVRSRLYLTKPNNGEDDDSPEARNERVLRTMKNNQAASGGKVPLRWKDGVFVRTDIAQQDNFVDRLTLDTLIVEALRAMVRDGVRVAADSAARNSLVTRAKILPGLRQYSFSALSASVERLRGDKRIVSVELGPPSKRYVFLRTPDTKYPGEGEE